MNTILMVPASCVVDLRDGLLGEWGFAAEDLSVLALQLGSEAPAAALDEPLELFDAGRGLLDLIGWRRQQPQQEVCINLDAHRLYPTIIIKALTSEQIALIERLDEVPRQADEYMRQVVRERITTLGDLIAIAEEKSKALRSRERVRQHRPVARNHGVLRHSRCA